MVVVDTDVLIWYLRGNEREFTTIEDFKSFSTKAAYAWATLYNDKYSTQLYDALEDLYDIKKGWYAGRYDKNNKLNTALTANTNAVILECINYKMKGPLLKITH